MSNFFNVVNENIYLKNINIMTFWDDQNENVDWQVKFEIKVKIT